MALDDAVALLADGRTATMLFDAAARRAGRARAGRGRRRRRRHAARAARPRGRRDGRRRRGQRGQAGARGLARRRRGRRLRRVAGPPARSTSSSTASAATSRARRSRSSRRGGRMLSYGLASGAGRASAPRRPPRAASRSSSPTAPGALRAAPSGRCAAGLTPVIGQRFPLEQRSRRPCRDRVARDHRQDTLESADRRRARLGRCQCHTFPPRCSRMSDQRPRRPPSPPVRCVISSTHSHRDVDADGAAARGSAHVGALRADPAESRGPDVPRPAAARSARTVDSPARADLGGRQRRVPDADLNSSVYLRAAVDLDRAARGALADRRAPV